MGSPAFAVPALRALHAAGHEIACVYTQPPKPAGRGHAVTLCPVHAAALDLGLEVRGPARLRRDEAAQRAFAALDLDVAVVAAYGLILPKPMLEAPRLGCVNIHASLLPRWRGAAPIQAAILAGDSESGITIMRMEEGLDTGPMLLREAVAIGDTTTTPELHDALAAMGARLIVRALAEQPESVRALNPWPGTIAQFGGETLKILAAAAASGAGPAGQVLDGRFVVACGDGALRLDRVQRAGRPGMPGDAFLRGVPKPWPALT
jgi:methionyl-tRNA formyltransferase